MNKLTIKNIEIKKKFIEVECIEVNGKEIILTRVPHGDIDYYLTHADCKTCSKEFKKQFTHSKICGACWNKDEYDKFYAKPLARADYKGMIYDQHTDKYFQDLDDVIEHYEEDKISLDNAMLLTTVESSFNHIDIEQISEEEVHEDWEPSDELLTKIDEFNEFLNTQRTRTFFPCDTRLDISSFLKSESDESKELFKADKNIDKDENNNGDTKC